jgi:hypothetical protein
VTYTQVAVPWHHFDVAQDRSTLTFIAFGAPCLAGGRVSLVDGFAPGEMTATLLFDRPVARGGSTVRCDTSLTELPAVVLRLEAPLPAEVVVVDGAPVDPTFCKKPMRQSVTAVPPSWTGYPPPECQDRPRRAD